MNGRADASNPNSTAKADEPSTDLPGQLDQTSLAAQDDDEVAQGEDVYGLLRDLQEDSEDPLGLAQKQEEQLFGVKDDPFAKAKAKAEEEKAKEPPPLPLVGVRMSYGAPAFAPLDLAAQSQEEAETWLRSSEAEQGFGGLERPIGLNGPFTVASTLAQENAEQIPAWMNAGQKDKDQDERGLGQQGLGLSRTNDEANEEWPGADLFAKKTDEASSTDKEKSAQGAGAPESLDFGLSDRTRVQLGTSPRRTSAVVRSSASESGFSPAAGLLEGADRFRIQPAQEGPFGSTGSVAKVVSAYLRQSSARSDTSGRVLSTLG
jgi:hypothetical protein